MSRRAPGVGRAGGTRGRVVPPRRGGGRSRRVERDRAVAARPVRQPRARLRRAVGRRTPEFMVLLGLVVTLNLVGLVMVLSASSVSALEQFGTSWYYVQRQAVWSVLGLGVLLFVQRFDYRRWNRWATPMLGFSLVLLLAVLVPGVGMGANGATRWLGYGPVVVQPSEVAKLGLLVFCASLLGRRIHLIHRTEVTLRPVLLVAGLVALLIMLQPNLGTTIVIGAIVATLLFVAGVPWRRIATIAVAGAAGTTLLAFAAPYRRARVLAFLDPWADPLNTGYQTIQAWAAIAEGGVSGVGVGASRAKWGFLPFAHTDFIFAIVAEEFGLLGAVTLVGMFALLALTGVRTALRAPDPFGMLLASGVTAWFAVQAFVNIGAVVGLLPITGVPLPFVSSGGSSLLSNMAAAGVLLSVARHAGPLGRRAGGTPADRRARRGGPEQRVDLGDASVGWMGIDLRDADHRLERTTSLDAGDDDRELLPAGFFGGADPAGPGPAAAEPARTKRASSSAPKPVSAKPGSAKKGSAKRTAATSGADRASASRAKTTPKGTGRGAGRGRNGRRSTD